MNIYFTPCIVVLLINSSHVTVSIGSPATFKDLNGIPGFMEGPIYAKQSQLSDAVGIVENSRSRDPPE